MKRKSNKHQSKIWILKARYLITCNRRILMLATSWFGDRFGTVARHDESSELFVTHGIADSVQWFTSQHALDSTKRREAEPTINRNSSRCQT
jgi:hypothetical protein